MKWLFAALLTAAVVGAAAPASAMSFTFDLPSLTFPPQPTPDTTQGCADLTTLNGATCTVPSR